MRSAQRRRAAQAYAINRRQHEQVRRDATRSREAQRHGAAPKSSHAILSTRDVARTRARDWEADWRDHLDDDYAELEGWAA